MDRMMDVGIMLTFVLIATSVFYTMATGLGIDPASSIEFGADLQYGAIQTDINSTDLPAVVSGSSGFDPLTTIIAFVLSVVNMVIVFLGYAFKMAFGWTSLVQAILTPVGLQTTVGLPLIGIFGFVQIVSMVEIVRRIVSAIRGAV